MAAFETLRDEALQYLRNGTSVMLVGHPGSGRSTTVRAVTGRLEDAGWTVVRVRGLAGLSSRPLEALAVADLVGAGAGRERGAVAAGVEAVERAIGAGRAVVAVDDADQLDDTSLGVLAAAITGRRVPLLASVSPARHAADLSLSALVRPGVQLAVPPLPYHETQELMQRICARPIHTATVAAVHARAGGLPGLVEAITEDALRRGLFLQMNDAVWVSSGDLWSPALRYPLEPFLQRLSAGALDGLVKLAHVGAIDVDAAQRLIAHEDLEELDDRGLLALAAHGGTIMVTVYPPLLAEHLGRERLGVRRVRLLEEIAAALEIEPDRFLLPGAAASDDEMRALAARLPVSAGADAENRALSEAMLNRLVQDNRSARILVERAAWQQRKDADSAVSLAMSLMVRGVEKADLEPVFATPIPAHDQKGRALLAATEATYLAYGRRDLRAALALLDERATGLGPWADLLTVTAHNLTLFLDRVPDRPPQTDSTIPLVADVQHLVRAQHLLAQALPHDALDELDAMTRSGEDPDTDTRAEIVRGVALVLAGELAAALAWSGPRYEQGRSQFDPDRVVGHGYVLALVHVVRGDDSALRAHLGPLLSLGVTPLRHSQYQLGTLVTASRLAALSHRPLTARALADQADAMGLHWGPFPLMAAEQAVNYAELAEGTDAEGTAESLWATGERLHEHGYTATALVVGCRAAELAPDAQRAERMLARAAETDAPLLEALARYTHALQADPDTQIHTGRALLDAGYDAFGIIVQVRAVQALRESDPPRAADLAQRLVELADRLGGGFRDLVEPVAARPTLTSREREVAELAAGGLSNGEIAGRLVVSVRTVENHLHRAFSKLGVQSRSALREALQQTA